MRDEMKRTMFELFGVGSEDDKVLAAGGKKPVAKPEPVKTAPVQAPAQPVVKAKAASYLAAGTSLEGTLRSDGDVEIAGAFKGEVITTGTVTLRSVIQSNITAGSLNLIGCTLTGDVKVTGTVTVSEDSQVTGNINAKELLCAGKVNGDLEITGGKVSFRDLTMAKPFEYVVSDIRMRSRDFDPSKRNNLQVDARMQRTGLAA